MERFAPEAAFSRLESLRARRPLVQNITNFVAMTVSANVLLALGASPAMVHAAEEAEDFAKIASSLVVNIGTLTPAWVASMQVAAAEYLRLGKPWVLDPVGVGATRLRNETAASLIQLKPAVIRGNAGEILALSGSMGGVKGVDSTAGSNAAIAPAISLARSSGAIIAVTGETDYVTDGQKVISVAGGHALMPQSTALGCALSAVVAAFVADNDPVDATVSALAVYAAAGAIAGRRVRGPGHLPAELCDALYNLTTADLSANMKISQVQA
ncbi:MAG: hydroxyethylthiazole kinase [Nitratireductor sp.]|nr:hydroxyethylthiazole kinase [Nitratireductor sp.]